MRKVLLIFLLHISLLLSCLAGPEYYFSSLSVKDGLSQLNVTSIFQDDMGYMWFGTRYGLNKYNGSTFEKFLHDNQDSTSISDDYIRCIAEDKDGNIWIGTADGLNKLGRDRRIFKKYFTPSLHPGTKSRMLSLYYDDNDILWVGTSTGVFTYDKESDSLKKHRIKGLEREDIIAITGSSGIIYIGTKNKGLIIYDSDRQEILKTLNTGSGLPTDYIRDVLVDRDENVWIGTNDKGIFVLRKGDSELDRFNMSNGLSSDMVRCIKESPTGEIWAGTFNGVSIINPVTKKISCYKVGVQGLLSHHSVYSLYFDRSQTIWVGTYAGGVNLTSQYSHLFSYYNPSDFFTHDIGILGQSVEFDGSFYICSEGGGLIEYDPKNNKFQQHLTPNTDSNSLCTIKSIFLDGNKIICGNDVGEVYEFDTRNKRFTLKYVVPDHRQVYFIGKSHAGEYIIGANSQKYGLILLSGNDWSSVTSDFPVEGQPNFNFTNVSCVREIEHGIFLIGTSTDGLYYYDMNALTLSKVDESVGFASERISDILIGHQGRIWVSTENGISEISIPNWTVKNYGQNDGLTDNRVCKILEGNDSQLWISTLHGISSLNLRTSEITNYGHNRGILVDEFSNGSGCMLSDGRMMFSGNNGFVIFNTNDIITNPNVPPIVFDNLYVNNKLVLPGDGSEILDESISTQKKIVLHHDQTNISVEFSALNYIFSEKNQYAYILEGFDKKWQYSGNQHIAYYTNIPAGSYTLRVKGSNNDGIWNEDGANLIIKVLPPIWMSWWAIMLYILALLFLAIFIIRHYMEKNRLENIIEMKKLEAEIHEESYQERNRLFTNFSHELRTPLTLIYAPLQELTKRTDLPEEVDRMVKLMLSNVKRLIRIVNNLMDLQKNESGLLKPKISEHDIMRFAQGAVDSFHDMAIYRNVRLKYIHQPESKAVWFDWDMLEKVFFNFLSNAFKNVPDGGKIDVEALVKNFSEVSLIVPQEYNIFKNKNIEYVYISIKDNGPGIAPDELEKIFRPFYQVAQNPHSKSGTGIGLSLSKKIIELHHGTVWAENAPEGGAIFKFVLPIDKSIFTDANIIENASDKVVDIEVEVPEVYSVVKNSGNKQYSILVVEDNRDLNDYICSQLSGTYDTDEAFDGEEALSKARHSLPDLIITDLMMPKMDGFELVEKLKSDVNTSHIPIIVLTAKTEIEELKRGFRIGADDYITKPFDADVLRIRVENLIQNRIKLQEKYSKNFSLESLGIEVQSTDEKFMQKLYSVLQQNLSNSEFNLDSFCKELGLSKSNLYRKIKQITGSSPNEFVRNFRLSTAAKMLKETDMSITDIYCAVGYNSLAYFSNSFKSLYGMSPTEYKNHS